MFAYIGTYITQIALNVYFLLRIEKNKKTKHKPTIKFMENCRVAFMAERKFSTTKEKYVQREIVYENTCLLACLFCCVIT